jgi:hypothetical protein
MGYLKREDTTSYSIRPGFVQGMSAWLCSADPGWEMVMSVPTVRVLKANLLIYYIIYIIHTLCECVFMEFPQTVVGYSCHSHRCGSMEWMNPVHLAQPCPIDVQVNVQVNDGNWISRKYVVKQWLSLALCFYILHAMCIHLGTLLMCSSTLGYPDRRWHWHGQERPRQVLRQRSVRLSEVRFYVSIIVDPEINGLIWRKVCSKPGVLVIIIYKYSFCWSFKSRSRNLGDWLGHHLTSRKSGINSPKSRPKGVQSRFCRKKWT